MGKGNRNSPNIRVIIVHEDWGIFLGHMLGLAFFSRVDSGGQLQAPTFKSFDDASDFVKGWKTDPPISKEKFRYVALSVIGDYANYIEMRDAGLESDMGNMLESGLRHMIPAGTA